MPDEGKPSFLRRHQKDAISCLLGIALGSVPSWFISKHFYELGVSKQVSDATDKGRAEGKAEGLTQGIQEGKDAEAATVPTQVQKEYQRELQTSHDTGYDAGKQAGQKDGDSTGYARGLQAGKQQAANQFNRYYQAQKDWNNYQAAILNAYYAGIKSPWNSGKIDSNAFGLLSAVLEEAHDLNNDYSRSLRRLTAPLKNCGLR